MIISFRSRELRDNALNEFISLFEYSAHIVDKLKFFLLVLNSSQNVVEFPLQHTLSFHGENLEISLDENTSIIFKQAHKNVAVAADGSLPWEKVTRLQLIEVRNTTC
ncbi:hypothetical protein F2A31_14555 [Acinetobacter suaedae]|uniref:Uncharacterized protein n=1 Tax=Acinetobacter suaedae TaxID=2609668 RepID=A0A5P1UXM0_9GAMM|nr:hypothetical protein [Acinetobacter sp. C16S1]QER40853.1 hypothetical protein F2A31_14555 [Acinetobacter sp. C16S1]